MLNRYPHTAQIEYTTEIDNGSGIPEIQTVTIDIPEGRYDPHPGFSKDVEYSAKFYCPVIGDPFQFDGAVLIFQGKRFSIVNLFNYQTHCEVWLD